MNSIQLTYGRKKDGTPNAIFDGLSRVVCSFPDVGGDDTRRGSPTTAKTMEANAALFCAAPELLAALEEVTDCILWYRQNGYMAGWDKPLKDALAAIAKVKGGEA
jgi:hypothetical protein